MSVPVEDWTDSPALSVGVGEFPPPTTTQQKGLRVSLVEDRLPNIYQSQIRPN